MRGKGRRSQGHSAPAAFLPSLGSFCGPGLDIAVVRQRYNAAATICLAVAAPPQVGQRPRPRPRRPTDILILLPPWKCDGWMDGRADGWMRGGADWTACLPRSSVLPSPSPLRFASSLVVRSFFLPFPFLLLLLLLLILPPPPPLFRPSRSGLSSRPSRLLD